jgi:uncharacterized protein YndB with AHSA1/START domain
MKWLWFILGGIVVLVALMWMVGSLLPREHVATRSARFKQPPEEIWLAITNYKEFMSWRPGLKSVEPLPDKNGWPQWKETLSDGSVLPLEMVEFVPNQRMVTRINNPALPFGGTWTYELSPADGGSSLRITENGYVNPALFRFLSRFVFGQTSTMESYLKALGKKFNEDVSPQP